MKSLGFYRQLRHGYPQGPDLTAAVDGSLASTARTEVARYLRECPVVAATTQRADDVLDTRHTNISGINIHTDGTYVWPEDLAYYVRLARGPRLLRRGVRRGRARRSCGASPQRADPKPGS